MKAIRGAITITHNTAECIAQGTHTLVSTIMSVNSIAPADVVSIIFTCTRDIDQAYPAKTAREMGFDGCALMCMQEMYVENSLPMCIRIMVLANTGNNIKHCYLEGAKILRSNL
ncbi:MAG: chorismate mutase [Clostridia bacterium]|nr:chorismate mutase [Clostridia bacterium]